MNITQAKELVKKNPKRISDFTRQKVEPGFLKRAVKVNYFLYNYNSCLRNNWRKAFSVGDGKLYGVKLVSTDGGKVAIPNPDLIIYQTPFRKDGSFVIND
jgi:hypothetical protein